MPENRSIFDRKKKTFDVKLNSNLASLFLIAIVLFIALIISIVWAFSYKNTDKIIVAQRPDSIMSSKVDSGEKTQSDGEQTLTGAVEYPLSQSAMRETAYFSDAVFVGDSITTGIDLYSTISTAKVVASTGVNLETFLTTKSVRNSKGDKVTIPEAVKELGAKKIYLMLGTNGIDWMSVESMIKQYQTVIDRLKKDNPDAIFYIQSIPPITKDKEAKSEQMSVKKIKEFNAQLLKLAQKNKMYFVDVFSALVSEDGYLSKDISTDGVHFNSSVYTTWIEYVRCHTSRYE